LFLEDGLKFAIKQNSSNCIAIYDTLRKKQLRILKNTSLPEIYVMLKLSNSKIISNDDNSLRIRNIYTGNCLKTLKIHGMIHRVVELSENVLVTVCYDKKITVWDIQENNKINSKDENKINNINNKECKAMRVYQSKLFAYAIVKLTKTEFAVSDGEDINIFDINKESETAIIVLRHPNASVTNLHYDEKLDVLLSLSVDVVVRLWDYRKSVCLNTIKFLANIIDEVRFVEPGVFLSCGVGGVVVWRFIGRECLMGVQVMKQGCKQVDVSGDKSVLAGVMKSKMAFWKASEVFKW